MSITAAQKMAARVLYAALWLDHERRERGIRSDLYARATAMLFAGLRPGELAALKWADVSWYRGVLFVRVRKEKWAARMVPLQYLAREALFELWLLVPGRDEEHIFPHARELSKRMWCLETESGALWVDMRRLCARLAVESMSPLCAHLCGGGRR